MPPRARVSDERPEMSVREVLPKMVNRSPDVFDAREGVEVDEVGLVDLELAGDLADTRELLEIGRALDDDVAGVGLGGLGAVDVGGSVRFRRRGVL